MEDELPLLQQRPRSKARTSLSSTVIAAFLVVLLWMGIRNELTLGPFSPGRLEESSATADNVEVESNKREIWLGIFTGPG